MLHRFVLILTLLAILTAGGCASSGDVDPGPRSPAPSRGAGANPLNLPTP